MKLSSIAVLFSAAIAALPGATATETVSLRGDIPEDQVLVAFANCQNHRNCQGGWNTCETLQKDCPENNCYWAGGNSRSGQQCRVDGGNRRPTRRPTRRPNNSPTRRPTRRPSGNRNCRNNNNRSSCENNNCEWLNGRCDIPCSSYNRNSCPSRCDLTNSGQCRAPVTRTVCSDYDDNRSRCRDNGCWWNTNSNRARCQLNCPALDNQRNNCLASGLCTWNSRNSQCDISNCNDLDGTSQTKCESNTGNACVWRNTDGGLCDFRNSEQEEEEVEQEE